MAMRIFNILILILGLCACTEKKAQDLPSHIITAKKTAQVQSLFYSGIIQPFNTVVVISPADGVIADMSFHFGEVVKKNQILFTIESEQFYKEYQTALMQYIKAKTDLNNAKSELTENEFLHKNQLISDDEFKSKQNNFYTAQLSFLQAKDAFSVFLQALNVSDDHFYDLKINDIAKITDALHMMGNSKQLKVFSSVEGVALLPIKNESNDNTHLVKGDSVKQGQVLAMIGNTQGFMLHVIVDEFNVDQFKVGQSVKVTVNALPKIELAGHISGVDRQGQIGQAGVPVFSMDITVPKVDLSVQAALHIGMSAKAQIDLKTGPVIAVPIQAIYQKKGMPYIQVDHDGTREERPVKTGLVTANFVVVENIREGEHVVVFD